MNKPTFFQMMVPALGAIFALVAVIIAIKAVQDLTILSKDPTIEAQRRELASECRQRVVYAALLGPTGTALVAIGFMARLKGRNEDE